MDDYNDYYNGNLSKETPYGGVSKETSYNSISRETPYGGVLGIDVG